MDRSRLGPSGRFSRHSRRRFLTLGAAAAGFTLLDAACGSSNKGSNANSPANAAKPSAPNAAANSAAANQPAVPGGGTPAAAGSPAAAATRAPQGPQTLRYGVGTLQASLNPNSTASQPPLYFALFDVLVKLNSQLKIEPRLATSWENPDPATWVFHLRPAQFSDGKPVTANDVKFTWDYVTVPANKSALLGRVSTIDGTDIVDPATVRLRTKGPDAALLKRAGVIFTLPQQYYTSVGPDGFTTKPIGSGPFMLQNYQQGAQLTIATAPNAWRKAFAVTQVTMQQIPDASTRLAGLQAGSLDLVDGLDVSQTAQVTADKSIKLEVIPSLAYAGYDMKYFDGPTKDVRVRTAVNLAVDKEGILKNVYKGYGAVMDGQMLTKETFGHNPNLKPFPYDPQQAKQLLAAAGYASGFTGGIEFTGSGTTALVPQAVAQNLADVGIKLDIQQDEPNVWLDGIYSRRPRQTLFWNPWTAFQADALFAMSWFLSTDQTKSYNNSDLDAAYNAAAQELDDNKREQDFWRATSVMNMDPPTLWITQLTAFTAHTTRLQGLSTSPIGFGFDEMSLA